MKPVSLGFTLSYEGEDADDHEIDFYDMAHALMGFQRSLAITTHLVLNNEVITQAPSLQGARIIARPPEEGSWEILALISLLGAGAYKLGTMPKDTPLGHLIHSAYDYVISETLGFHVDYDKSIGKQLKECREQAGSGVPVIEQSQLDSVVEKCETAILIMHRPIIYSHTATQAKITATIQGQDRPLAHVFNSETFDYINFTKKGTDVEEVEGYISSYNSNTYKGRIFLPEMRRPISFMLADTAQNANAIGRITRSLHMNAQERMKDGSLIQCSAYKNLSRTGRLKSLLILDVEE